MAAKTLADKALRSANGVAHRDLTTSRHRPPTGMAGAGNRAVAQLAAAVTAGPTRPNIDQRVDRMMRNDIAVVLEHLNGVHVSDGDEEIALRRVRKWQERDEIHRTTTGYPGTDHLDRFLFLLRTTTFDRRSMASVAMAQKENVHDLLYSELTSTRLAEFRSIVATSRKQRSTGPDIERMESAASFVGKREVLGAMGLVKGMSTSLASMVDVAAWAGAKSIGLDAPKFSLADDVKSGWNEMGEGMGGLLGVDSHEQTIGSLSAMDIGHLGGQVIGALSSGVAMGKLGLAGRGLMAAQAVKGIGDLGIAVEKLRRGPPERSWAEIAARPDVWSQVVGAVASVVPFAGPIGSVAASARPAIEALKLGLDVAQVGFLVASYRAIDHEPGLSPAERSERKAETLASILTVGLQRADDRWGAKFQQRWGAQHAEVNGQPADPRGGAPSSGEIELDPTRSMIPPPDEQRNMLHNMFTPEQLGAPNPDLYDHSKAFNSPVGGAAAKRTLQKLAHASFAATGDDSLVKVVPASYSALSDASGFVTKLKYVKNCSPAELVDRLGVTGLKDGVTIYQVDLSAVQPEMLGLRGYSTSPDGKHPALSRPVDLLDYPEGSGVPQWKLPPVPVKRLGGANAGQEFTP